MIWETWRKYWKTVSMRSWVKPTGAYGTNNHNLSRTYGAHWCESFSSSSQENYDTSNQASCFTQRKGCTPAPRMQQRLLVTLLMASKVLTKRHTGPICNKDHVMTSVTCMHYFLQQDIAYDAARRMTVHSMKSRALFWSNKENDIQVICVRQ